MSLQNQSTFRGAHQHRTGWSHAHNPGENAIATYTKAAPGVKHRLVITGFDIIVSSDETAPTAVLAIATLVDGAGNTYAAYSFGVPATAGQTNGVAKDNLWIPLPENRSATLAFAAASGAQTHQSVNLRGVIEAMPQ